MLQIAFSVVSISTHKSQRLRDKRLALSPRFSPHPRLASSATLLRFPHSPFPFLDQSFIFDIHDESQSPGLDTLTEGGKRSAESPFRPFRLTRLRFP
jgi:hypothetical protein